NGMSVAGVPGSAFGSSGFVRLSYAASEESLREAIKRIAEFCAKLT
ncbi:MAG: aspartate aminotransferase, partial [Planctomycetes bacterium]|nr:aspartate aminotransferase [Planctomycetota bacterium]